MPETVINALDIMLFKSHSVNHPSNAVVTLDAFATRRNIVRGVYFSYETIPGGAADHLLTIAWTRDGVAKTFTYCLVAATVAQTSGFEFPEGFIVGDTNTVITITLVASGTADSFANLNVFYRI